MYVDWQHPVQMDACPQPNAVLVVHTVSRHPGWNPVCPACVFPPVGIPESSTKLYWGSTAAHLSSALFRSLSHQRQRSARFGSISVHLLAVVFAVWGECRDGHIRI